VEVVNSPKRIPIPAPQFVIFTPLAVNSPVHTNREQAKFVKIHGTNSLHLAIFLPFDHFLAIFSP
jgi:hypothetical protein